MARVKIGPHSVRPETVDAILERDKGAVVILSNGQSFTAEGQTVAEVEKIVGDGAKPAKAK